MTLLHILHGTPNWVFVLFALLLALGMSQLRTREMGFGRVISIALGMTAFSAYGTLAAFGRMPLALAGWLTGAAVVLSWLVTRPAPAGTRWDPERRRFTVPGSALPLALMMGIFFTKYGVAVATALHPALRDDLRLAAPACLLYGACTGAFVGRAMRLWRLTQRASGAAPARVAAAAFGEQA